MSEIESEEYVAGRSSGDEDNVSLSPLQQLAAEMAVPLADDLVEFHIPDRPHIKVTYDTRISWELAKEIRKQSTDQHTGEVDSLMVAALTLAAQSKKVTIRGEELRSEMGDLVTLASPVFREITGATSTTEALRIFFGRDMDVIAHDQKISEALELKRREKELDPTA